MLCTCVCVLTACKSAQNCAGKNRTALLSNGSGSSNSNSISLNSSHVCAFPHVMQTMDKSSAHLWAGVALISQHLYIRICFDLQVILLDQLCSFGDMAGAMKQASI